MNNAPRSVRTAVPNRNLSLWWVYVLCAALAIVGLVFNIKTVPLNDARLALQTKTAQLRQETKQMELTLFQLTSPEQLQRRAKELNMAPPATVQYYYVHPPRSENTDRPTRTINDSKN